MAEKNYVPPHKRKRRLFLLRFDGLKLKKTKNHRKKTNELWYAFNSCFLFVRSESVPLGNTSETQFGVGL